MDFTGERFVPEVDGDIKLEHVHRYLAVRHLVAGKRVLDIACGEGYGSKILSEFASAVTGVDIDDESVKHAHATYANEKIRFLAGSITTIPLDNACVDAVISFETLEHLTDHQTMMREIRRVLTPSGILVISSPDKREYSDVPSYKNPYHMRELYLSEFRALLTQQFTNHAIYGQRVHYASVIAPTDHHKSTFTGYREDETGGVIEGDGLPNAVYLIAVASDAPLPELSAGLFIPHSPPYHRDLSFLSHELEMHQRKVAAQNLELEQRADHIHNIESELAVAGNDIATLKQQRAEEQAALNEAKKALSQAANDLLAEIQRRHNSGDLLMAEINARGAHIDNLTTELHQAYNQLTNTRNQLHAAHIQIHAMYNSVSWKFARPVRLLSRIARKLRRLILKTLRAPLALIPTDTKKSIRNKIFLQTGSLFANTGAHHRWQTENAPPETTPTQIASPTIGTPTLTTPPWSAEQLPPANGTWEWADLAPMRSRIATILAERKSTITYSPRPTITLATKNLATEAAQINLPNPGPTPDVSIIIPAYNELATTIECLLSIANTTGNQTFEVILANDASTDDTATILSTVPHLTLVNQEQNLGFLRNCNIAASHAKGHQLILLNNDTQVSPNWLTALTTTLNDPTIGIAGPRIIYPNGVLQEAGNRIRRNGTVEMLGLTDIPENPRWNYARDVDYVSGACLAMNRSLWEELGGFSDDLAPAYCEDLDFSLRVHAKNLRIRYTPDAEIYHHLSLSSNGQSDSYKYTLIARNMQTLSQRHQSLFDKLDDIRIIALYLPQFHPVPENDLWWGPGFTEWKNVAKALPNYIGHHQPRIPADLGFYDLRLAEIMEAQWKLAANYGIDGFCYYYYWFNGHRMLERPIEHLRNPTTTAHPFCLCWANENWTRTWDGMEQNILLAQNHSPNDDIAVINDIATYMRHPNYITIRNKPLILIYRTDLFPNFAETAARWRSECRNNGIGEIYIVMVNSFRFAGVSTNPATYGCDASMEFPAHYLPDTKQPTGAITNREFQGTVGSYEDSAARFATREHPGFPRFRTVMPGWDNTPRRQNNSFILENPTPGVFQAWLETAIAETKRDFQGDERLVFINAWNEWGEGAYLEPDSRFGHSFLEAVRNARDAEFLGGPKI